ncbi:MAG: D-glycerate dehydrogenase [Acidobacteria bacterium]|nr:MAG: D-glycerate dehydrogenase [Acidobacteriota bacterium]PYU49160.1 MAG: D-glycerate dehydrogenase [Acidobacteriota bacterium]PYU73187.1 MAG: D-glycerate dehydrogenase [Acidobacteriota bacterium]
MPKPKVFATHGLFDVARQILQKSCDVQYWTKPGRPPREEVLQQVKEKEGLICLLTEKVNEDLLREAPNLRIAANVAVGFDNIDVAACTKRGVAATNTPGVLDETTADFAWTLLMAVARRLSEGEALARSGNWKNWDLDQLVGTDVWGKTLGIVGFGRIGRAVARRASGFQMKVIYTDAVRPAEEVEKELKVEFREMNALLAESDFISVHVPLLPETRGLFDSPKFYRMKPTAFLINTSRGSVVDEAALVAALESGKIAGAGLDVYENEPFIHPGLKRANVVLAPHIASASLETRTKMACIAAENVVALFTGKRPPNVLNPEVLKVS